MFDDSIGMFVYEYTFLDDLSYIRSIHEKHTINQIPVSEIFKKHGWEGDGEIGMIWLPPFLIDDGRTDGVYLWHVKQRNNGISYIISPCELPFGYLGTNSSSGETFASLSEFIVEDNQKLKEWHEEIIAQSRYLNTIPDTSEKEKLAQRALTSLHDDIISEFKLWIDSYYLKILQEIFIHKNSKIKINLPKMKINTENTSDDLCELPIHQKNWLLQVNFTSFAWNSFKEYSMKDKLEAFYNSVNYKPDEQVIKCINFHMEIRNCIHHESGIVTKKLLKKLGAHNISLESGEIYSIGEKIKLTAKSISYFIDSLNNFINSYHNHMVNFFGFSPIFTLKKDNI